MKANSTVLFEYGDWAELRNKEDDDIDAFEKQLVDIWSNRNLELSEEERSDFVVNDNPEEVKKKDYQPFLSINHKKQIRARNWVGFIQNENELIEIYPKIFNGKNLGNITILKHIFFWLDYCARWKFPHCKAGLATNNIDSFLELMILLFASHIKEIVEEKPLSLYQMKEERLLTPKGSLNFNRYINNSLVTGNWQYMECDHEPFEYDNTVNRVLKYCARLLLNQTKISTNQNLLADIIFTLDDVEDLPCTVHDLQKVKLNPFFEEYHLALDYCKMILEQQIYSSDAYDLMRWSLLFPMELIFEEFIAGFIEQKFSKEWKVKSQKSDKYLVEETNPELKIFKMKHDIFLENIKYPGRKIIIDTKYKIRDEKDISDNKKGVAQADLYQMISYAYKRGCEEIILIYPNNKSDGLREPSTFKINSGISGCKFTINIKIVEVPFWREDAISANDFIELKESLKKKLDEVLK